MAKSLLLTCFSPPSGKRGSEHSHFPAFVPLFYVGRKAQVFNGIEVLPHSVFKSQVTEMDKSHFQKWGRSLSVLKVKETQAPKAQILKGIEVPNSHSLQ